MLSTFRAEIDGLPMELCSSLQSGLSVVPCVNLVSNVGFGKDATHTINSLDSNANLPLSSMSFPLREPYGLAVSESTIIILLKDK